MACLPNILLLSVGQRGVRLEWGPLLSDLCVGLFASDPNRNSMMTKKLAIFHSTSSDYLENQDMHVHGLIFVAFYSYSFMNIRNANACLGCYYISFPKKTQS